MASIGEVPDLVKSPLDMMEAPLKADAHLVGLKVHFLCAILSEERKKQIKEDGNFPLRIRVSLGYVRLERLWPDFKKAVLEGAQCEPLNLEGLVHGMKKQLEVLNPDIQEIYTTLSKSSRPGVENTDESAVIKHLNSLLNNFELLPQYLADSTNPFEKELEAAQKGLRFLRNFVGFAASMSSKLGELKDLLIHAEAVAGEVTCLLYLCCDNNKLEDEMISWLKLELLDQVHKIMPRQIEVRKMYVKTLKSLNSATNTVKEGEYALGFLDSLRENLLELLGNSSGLSLSHVKDQMLALHEELRFLECLVVDSAVEIPEVKDLSERSSILIREAACFIFSFYDDEASQWEFLVLDLLGNIKIAKEDAREVYHSIIPKSLRSNFPITNAEGFVSSLLQNLKQLLSSKGNSIAPLKHHIEAVIEELYSLKDDFSKITWQTREQAELECHWIRFKDVAYQTEYVIDISLVTKNGIWFHKLGLFYVIEEIKEIRAGLRQIRRNLPAESKMGQNFLIPTSAKDEVLAFETESDKILEQLTHGSEELNIISIVGMPGIGKTTLANSVYRHDLVAYSFHIHASCCVGKAYDTKRLLLEILKQVSSHPLDYSGEDLDFKLYQCLKNRRYLIFLDDVWDFELLNNMRNTFPDDGNGSRIMLTSRLVNIASNAAVQSVSHCLSPLPDDKSWQMLKFKVFGKGSCPEELVELGQRIAIACGGLPLSIDLMAGVLREMDKKQDCWLQIGQIPLTELSVEPEKRCLEVLEISYNHLPDQLKPCFLYFAGFPQDIFIHAKRLEEIWIAEGFIQVTENYERSLDEVAQMYLDQLISRSLIMVAERGSLNRVKQARIHDLLHDFAVIKATKEGFLLPINGYSDFSTLSTFGCPWSQQSRLFIYPDKREEFFTSNPSGPRVRSLVFPYNVDMLLTSETEIYDYPINLSLFLLLRVFNLPDINIKQLPSSLLQLIHLRFLEIKTCDRQVFSGILKRLKNLQTLIIMTGIGQVFPFELSLDDIENIAKLRFLRHFKVPGFSFPCISEEAFEKLNGIPFDNLHLLSDPLLCSEENHHEKFMKQMTNLWRLKCLIGNSSNLKLDFLMNLESLSLIGKLDGEFHTSMFSFPPYLKKLSLKFMNISWTNISSLCKLEHLEVLKIQMSKSSTEIWDMIELNQRFPKLKYLQFFYLNIKVWNASFENLPLLERLQVTYCTVLKQLPSGLVGILNLREIMLTRCPNSLAISAEKIKEEQAELGNDQLVVRKMHLIDEDLEKFSVEGSEKIFLSIVNGLMNGDENRS